MTLELASAQGAKWFSEVPGTRWFRADLHLHTLDDHWGNRVPQLSSFQGQPSELQVSQYAKAFLNSAIRNGIQVLGLTPHNISSDAGTQLSATWAILEQWQSGSDEQGEPFASKIFAVFPGFEPSLSDGGAGIHILFLFDPTIPLGDYRRVCTALMGGVDPWHAGKLQTSTLDMKAAVQVVERLKSAGKWQYMCLAPHAFGTKGLFELKESVLQLFPSEVLCGLELGDDQLPEDAFRKKAWLRPKMDEYRQAFFYASDTYDLREIGKRYTYVKLATPTIEALRQAFLANGSRLRLPYTRADQGLKVSDDVPELVPETRVWLKQAQPNCNASFFRPRDPDSPPTTFSFSPDLTCVIGPRMTGKSTLLDGLRYALDAPLPKEELLAREVTERALNFASGTELVKADVYGSGEDKRFTFFAQRELQFMSRDQSALADLLFTLSPTWTSKLRDLTKEIEELDGRLRTRAEKLAQLDQTYREAVETYSEAKSAQQTIDLMAEHGMEAWKEKQRIAGQLASLLEYLQQRLFEEERQAEIQPPPFTEIGANALERVQVSGRSLKRTLQRAEAARRLARVLFSELIKAGKEAYVIADQDRHDAFEAFKQSLASTGGNTHQLRLLDELAKTAQDIEPRKARVQTALGTLRRERHAFLADRRLRVSLVNERRCGVDHIANSIEVSFEGAIKLEIRPFGDKGNMFNWVAAFKNNVLTRWWKKEQPLPEEVDSAKRQGRLAELECTPNVTSALRGLSNADIYQLQALRCEDLYVLQLRMEGEGSEYKPLQKLSGGGQISLLLTLLLQSSDRTPLVIDQPEDELDKGFLFDHVLPALRQLKGMRQVIVATHDANIVVNGDADHVILLDAGAKNGWVAAEGSIEHSAIRDAILKHLDGGAEAFRSRKRKYGF